MKIGLYYDDLAGWQGGRDFFKILVQSLQAACPPDDQIEIVAHSARDQLPWRLARLGKHILKRYPWDRNWMAQEIARIPKEELLRQAVGRSVRIEWLSGSAKQSDWSRISSAFDVIGPLRSPPSDQLAAWVAYIPDCQHRKLPHYFSAEERAQRDGEFSELLRTAPVAIVNSAEAKGDLTNYYGTTNAKIIALPFAAAPNPSWFDIDEQSLRKKYNLPSKYFLCSNQFWIHKNHGVLFEALAIAKTEGRVHCAVFTGDTHDYRDPSHFEKLVEHAKELNVLENCYFLGLLPKIDQIGLMRSAIAVIQPTLFEGGPGGGAVYDALAVGQRVIVSDIPVNREIQKYVDEYFPPANSEALFLAMCRAEEGRTPKRPKELLLMDGQKRLRQCGQVLRSAFMLAIERSRPRCASATPASMLERSPIQR